MDDLFPVETSLSPKLRWLADNCLSTRRLESGRWECSLDDENFARGEDEEEACVVFCLKTGMKHSTQI